MYILERFGTLMLPALNPVYDMNTVEAQRTIVRTVAGGFDTAGDGQAPENLPQPISYQGVILEDTLALWRDAIDALRAMSRKRARLYRRADDDEAVQFCTARLMSAQTERSYRNPYRVYEVRLRFMQLSPWVGHDHTTWALDEGYYLDDALYLDEPGYTYTLNATPKTVAVVNGGNRATSNVRFTFTAGSASITAPTLTGNSAQILIASIIAAGETLVIDCGAQSVLNDGTAAYSEFNLSSNHIIDEWFVLLPGTNIITTTYTSAATNGTLLIEYQDGWE